MAFLAACYLVGQAVGQFLGIALGIGGNVGGVGIGMLLLVLVNDSYYKTRTIHPETKNGILFWSSMYIPVVVAMSSVLNVKAALTGGWVAAASGIVATASCYFLVPVLAKLAKSNSTEKDL